MRSETALFARIGLLTALSIFAVCCSGDGIGTARSRWAPACGDKRYDLPTIP